MVFKMIFVSTTCVKSTNNWISTAEAYRKIKMMIMTSSRITDHTPKKRHHELLVSLRASYLAIKWETRQPKA